MTDSRKPHEVDILRLLEDVYAGDPEALRERGLHRAVSALEDTHRQAAMAMRRLETQGVPAVAKTPARVAAATPAAAPAAEPAPPAKLPPAAPPAQVVSGEGAQVDMGHRTLTHIVRPRGK